MRALIHYKNSNVNWCILLKHFKRYSQFSNFAVKTSTINEKIHDNVTKSIQNNDSKISFLNKSLGSPISLKNLLNTKSNSMITDKIEEIFTDRYSHQLKIMSQIQDEVNKSDDTNVCNGTLEYTIHSCLKPLRRELKDLFPDRDIMKEDSSFSVVCLNHHTNANMSTWDSSVAEERIALANLFVNSSTEICSSLKHCGFWADFIDPFKGAPYYGPHTNDTLFETDPRMRNFGLEIEDLGCCKVLCHPIWKENVFTGLIFTNAPADHPILNLLHNETS